MNKYRVIGAGAGMLLLLGFLFWDRATPAKTEQRFERLEGTLYRGAIEAMEKKDRPLPSTLPPLLVVDLYSGDLTPLNLDPGMETFIVRVTTDVHRAKRLNTPSKAAPTRPARGRAAFAQSGPAATGTTTLTVPPPAFTYKYLDQILDSLDAVYLTSQRYQKADIAFELRQIARWQERYLLKYAVANTGSREFFIARVLILADGRAVSAGQYAPISCRAGETIEGINVVSAADVRDKVVSVKLHESNRPYPSWEIHHVRYSF